MFQIGLLGLYLLLASPAAGRFPNREYQAEEVIGKSPSQILSLRGFKSEEHYVRTRDGYNIHLLRVIHPNHEPSKRPILFNHGLIETCIFWLIASRDVKPFDATGCGEIPAYPDTHNSTFYSNGPMMLSSAGYDVWLLSMRGTEMAMGLQALPPPMSEFYDYSLDDYGLIDVPTAINFIRKQTGAPKIGYIGHSQATFAIFALLSTTSSYADVLEPVVAVAPVAYFKLITSINRVLYDYAWLIDLYENRSGRFPLNAALIRGLLSMFCSASKVVCHKVKTKIGGKGEKWPRGYFSQLPYTASWKVLRHFGQLSNINSFQRYDYGPRMNLIVYNSSTPPPYNESLITSKSLILIYSRTDALSTPNDVKKFKSGLTVPLYKDIYIDEDYNHFDLVTGSLSGKMVYKPILEACEKFEAESGSCSKSGKGTNARSADDDKGNTRSGLLGENDIKSKSNDKDSTKSKFVAQDNTLLTDEAYEMPDDYNSYNIDEDPNADSNDDYYYESGDSSS